MASRARLSYRRLKKLSVDEIDTDQDDGAAAAAAAAAAVRSSGADQSADLQAAVVRSKKLHAWRAAASSRWLRRLCWRRRPRIRVAGLIRRLLQGKGAGGGGAKVVIRSAVVKVVKRLKEGRPYLGELFAGNYMFMQVSPSPTMAYVDKSSFLPPHLAAAAAAGGHHCHHACRGVCTAPAPSTGFGVPRN